MMVNGEVVKFQREPKDGSESAVHVKCLIVIGQGWLVPSVVLFIEAFPIPHLTSLRGSNRPQERNEGSCQTQSWLRLLSVELVLSTT